MAKSQTTVTKKDKENKRLQKRKEKEQRREERKANAKEGMTLQDMMAFVDEYGNITSTPPDPKNKRVIRTDEIIIGARKHEETAPNSPRQGRVTFFNTSKGYGFIKDIQTQESIFVHINSLTSPIAENDNVTFETQKGNKGPVAVNIKKV